MTEHVVLVSGLGSVEVEAFRSRLGDLGYVLHTASDVAQMVSLIRSETPLAILLDGHSLGDTLADLCNAVKSAGYPQKLIALNRDGHMGRGVAIQAGVDMVLDYPLNWHDLNLWLQTPRSEQGRLMSVGMLLGNTQEDILGAASLLAHDLKSPITIVISTLEMLLSLEEEKPEESVNARLMRGALQSSYRQMYLMSDLIDVARLELGSYELQMTRVDLVQLVGECLEQEQHLLDTKHLDVEVNLAEEALWVDVDIDLVNRVFSAMLDNTLKFTIRNDRLIIDVCREDDQVILRFMDTGRPIIPGFEQDIMRRAPQWDGRQAGSRTSVAMGLPFIAAVAEAHHGSFTGATHPVTKLTSFTFALPAAPAQPVKESE